MRRQVRAVLRTLLEKERDESRVTPRFLTVIESEKGSKGAETRGGWSAMNSDLDVLRSRLREEHQEEMSERMLVKREGSEKGQGI